MTIKTMNAPDFKLRNLFSLVLLYPVSKKAEQWTNRNISDDCNTLGGGIAIEPRYFEDIYEGIKDAGLTLKSV